jgi:diguanylate cyclase (GGDEF)-like protein/PAS domain S-box-containing protein/putative nucleotidyltransferase with HDIG domain
MTKKVNLSEQIKQKFRNNKLRETNEKLRESNLKLKERIKELKAFYYISELVRDKSRSIDDILDKLSKKIGTFWQYPEITAARIRFRDKEFSSANFKSSSWKQSSKIIVDGIESGEIEIYYLEERNHEDEGPFLKEERKLLEALSNILGEALENRSAAQELEKSNQRLDSLISQTPSVIYSYTSVADDFELNYINKNVNNLLGISSNDFKEHPDKYLEWIHPDDKDLFLKKLSKITYADKSIDEYRIMDSRGNYHWVRDYQKVCSRENNIIEVVGSFWDITQYKLVQQELERSEKRYRTIFDSAPMGIMIEDKQGNILAANDKLSEITGYAKSELEGSSVFNLMVLPEDQEIAEENIKRIIAGEDLEFDILSLKKSDHQHYTHLKETSILLGNGEKGVLSMQIDINDRIEQEKEIKYLLYRDVLTDLYNRRFIKEELERLDSSRQLPISIIMADINGLKIINDSYGHSAGDELLIKTAEILKKELRQEELLARYGGDEFIILLPQTSKKEAQVILNRIKESCRRAEEDKLPISISFGLAVKENMEQEINDVLKQADDLMYQNKLLASRSSKSKIVSSLLSSLKAKSDETQEHALRMISLASELAEKLELSNSEINRLALLATLHDIGKTTISEKILTKKAKLTKQEWKIMKEHCERGYKIASSSEEFALVADEILAHHEYWNGSGYPRGLYAEGIPYLARIISIIDAYDVMTNDRSYSPAVPKEEALKEIERCAGSQFDPELAAEFINMMRDKN